MNGGNAAVDWELRTTGRDWVLAHPTGEVRGQTLTDTSIEITTYKANWAWATCQPLLDPNLIHFQSRRDISVRAEFCAAGIRQNTPQACAWKEKHWLEEETRMHSKSNMERRRNKDGKGNFLSVMNTTKSLKFSQNTAEGPQRCLISRSNELCTSNGHKRRWNALIGNPAASGINIGAY